MFNWILQCFDYGMVKCGYEVKQELDADAADDDGHDGDDGGDEHAFSLIVFALQVLLGANWPYS